MSIHDEAPGPSHASRRPLTVDEWEKRLGTAERLLEALEVEIAKMIAAVDKAGDATGMTEAERIDCIHTAAGRLGSLKNSAYLARRRIERGLV